MPLPIRLNNDKENSFQQDYSFLASFSPTPSSKKTVEASNQEADTLLNIWANGEKINEDTYKVSSIDKMSLNKLQLRGLVTVKDDVVSFTRSGKIVITTMALGENNALDKDKKNVSYKEILANMDKRNKKGYRIPKMASTHNNIDLRNI